MADFTTWSAVKTQMENDLNNRDLLLKKYKTPDGREIQYNTPEEWQSWYSFVCGQANAESATSGVSSRSTTARPNSDTW